MLGEEKGCQNNNGNCNNLSESLSKREGTLKNLTIKFRVNNPVGWMIPRTFVKLLKRRLIGVNKGEKERKTEKNKRKGSKIKVLVDKLGKLEAKNYDLAVNILGSFSNWAIGRLSRPIKQYTHMYWIQFSTQEYQLAHKQSTS